jgi:hypothetical protein
MTGASGVPQRAPPVVMGYPINDKNITEPPERTTTDEEVSEGTRVQ